jgi:hypothetical protein
VLDTNLRDVSPSQVVAVDIRPGSTLDTADQRANFASSPDYLLMARAWESRGALSRVAATSLDGGRIEIIVWRPTIAAPWVSYQR